MIRRYAHALAGATMETVDGDIFIVDRGGAGGFALDRGADAAGADSGVAG